MTFQTPFLLPSPLQTMADLSALRITETREGTRLEVHARPRAKASRVGGVREGALEVSLAAPPVDGAANEELVAFLSAALALPKRDVVLVRGDGSRKKLVEVRGLSEKDVRARLEAFDREKGK